MLPARFCRSEPEFARSANPKFAPLGRDFPTTAVMRSRQVEDKQSGGYIFGGMKQREVDRL